MTDDQKDQPPKPRQPWRKQLPPLGRARLDVEDEAGRLVHSETWPRRGRKLDSLELSFETHGGSQAQLIGRQEVMAIRLIATIEHADAVATPVAPCPECADGGAYGFDSTGLPARCSKCGKHQLSPTQLTTDQAIERVCMDCVHVAFCLHMARVATSDERGGFEKCSECGGERRFTNWGCPKHAPGEIGDPELAKEAARQLRREEQRLTQAEAVKAVEELDRESRAATDRAHNGRMEALVRLITGPWAPPAGNSDSTVCHGCGTFDALMTDPNAVPTRVLCSRCLRAFGEWEARNKLTAGHTEEDSWKRFLIHRRGTYVRPEVAQEIADRRARKAEADSAPDGTPLLPRNTPAGFPLPLQTSLGLGGPGVRTPDQERLELHDACLNELLKRVQRLEALAGPGEQVMRVRATVPDTAAGRELLRSMERPIIIDADVMDQLPKEVWVVTRQLGAHDDAEFEEVAAYPSKELAERHAEILNDHRAAWLEGSASFDDADLPGADVPRAATALLDPLFEWNKRDVWWTVSERAVPLRLGLPEHAVIKPMPCPPDFLDCAKCGQRVTREGLPSTTTVCGPCRAELGNGVAGFAKTQGPA